MYSIPNPHLHADLPWQITLCAASALPPGRRLHHITRSPSVRGTLVRTGSASLRKCFGCRSARPLRSTAADVPAALVESWSRQYAADGPTAEHGNARNQYEEREDADPGDSRSRSAHRDHLDGYSSFDLTNNRMTRFPSGRSIYIYIYVYSDSYIFLFKSHVIEQAVDFGIILYLWWLSSFVIYKYLFETCPATIFFMIIKCPSLLPVTYIVNQVLFVCDVIQVPNVRSMFKHFLLILLYSSSYILPLLTLCMCLLYNFKKMVDLFKTKFHSKFNCIFLDSNYDKIR